MRGRDQPVFPLHARVSSVMRMSDKVDVHLTRKNRLPVPSRLRNQDQTKEVQARTAATAAGRMVR